MIKLCLCNLIKPVSQMEEAVTINILFGSSFGKFTISSPLYKTSFPCFSFKLAFSSLIIIALVQVGGLLIS